MGSEGRKVVDLGERRGGQEGPPPPPTHQIGRIPQWVYYRLDEIGPALTLLLRLIDQAVPQQAETSGDPWMAVRYGKVLSVGELTRDPPRTARRHLRRLEELGVVRIRQSKLGLIVFVLGPKWRDESRYVVDELPAKLPPSKPRPAKNGRPRNLDRPKMAALKSQDRPKMAALKPQDRPKMAGLDDCNSIGDLKMNIPREEEERHGGGSCTGVRSAKNGRSSEPPPPFQGEHVRIEGPELAGLKEGFPDLDVEGELKAMDLKARFDRKLRKSWGWAKTAFYWLRNKRTDLAREKGGQEGGESERVKREFLSKHHFWIEDHDCLREECLKRGIESPV